MKAPGIYGLDLLSWDAPQCNFKPVGCIKPKLFDVVRETMNHHTRMNAPSTAASNPGSSPGETCNYQPLLQLVSPRGLHHPTSNVSFNQLPKIKALDLLVQAETQHLRIGTDTRLTPCANGPSWYCSTSPVSFLHRARVTAARGQTACSLLMAHTDSVAFGCKSNFKVR